LEKILVISPHADDEVLGCGGTLLRCAKHHLETAWLLVTSVSTSNGFSKEHAEIRSKEISTVKNLLGISRIFEIGLKPTSLNSNCLQLLISHFERVVNDFRPTTVYLPFRGDIHSDHRIIFEAFMPFAKSFRYPFIKKILMYETVSETDLGSNLLQEHFKPNLFTEITEFIDRKIQMMRIYDSEFGDHPFPRSEDSITSLAKLRGSQAGVKFAEAFQILKIVESDHIF
jgi:LmbE family N-acetylglucosaminyl deacetylase